MNKINYLRRIAWSEIKRRFVISHKEMYEKLQWCENHKELRVKKKSLWESYRTEGSWWIERNNRTVGGLVVLYIAEKVDCGLDGILVIPTVYKSFLDDDKKNENCEVLAGRSPGQVAYSSVKEKFNELNKVDMYTAFGKDKFDLRKCVPGSFHWINQQGIKRLSDNHGIVHHASGVDWCSHYPTNHCGLLPDMNTAKIVQGRVKPDKEYPFAFYPDTGNIAEFRGNWVLYDTHNWANDFTYADAMCSSYSLYAKRTGIKDNITILVKASKYRMDEVFEYFYARRKTDPIAKLVMNAYIGNEHSTPIYQSKEDELNGIYIKDSHYIHRLAHLAAVCIARANHATYSKVNEMIFDDCTPLEIIVDGFIYAGKKEYGVYQKKLGNLEQEFVDCDFQAKYDKKKDKFLINNYIVTKEQKLVKLRHSAYNHRDDGINIEEYTGVNTMEHWDKVNQLRLILDDMHELIVNKDKIYC